MKKTNRILWTLALGALVLPLMTWAADNPLKKASVGDWVEFTTRTAVMGQNMEMTMKQSVVAKDATSVTLRTASMAKGKEMPPQDTKILLDQPYEPYAAGLTDAKVTTLGEGDETITVGGKPYACHWVKVKVVATKPQAVESTSKVWTCKDVPVSGLVKMESESTVKAGEMNFTTKMVMELIGSGTGK